MALFWQALTIMTLGMGLVFVFLFILIQAVRLAAVIVRRFEPPEADEPIALAPASPAAVAAAIAVAVTEYRTRNR